LILDEVYCLKSIALWVLRVLTAAVFLFAAFMKITSQPVMVAYFDIVGLGQGFRYVVGLLELVGGAALLIPRTSLIGTALLLFVDMGAFVAQVTRLHEDLDPYGGDRRDPGCAALPATRAAFVRQPRCRA
jgi:putative oxidoreductase